MHGLFCRQLQSFFFKNIAPTHFFNIFRRNTPTAQRGANPERNNKLRLFKRLNRTALQMVIVVMRNNDIINFRQFRPGYRCFVIARNSQRQRRGISENRVKNQPFAVKLHNCRRMSQPVKSKNLRFFGKIFFAERQLRQRFFRCKRRTRQKAHHSRRSVTDIVKIIHHFLWTLKSSVFKIRQFFKCF